MGGLARIARRLTAPLAGCPAIAAIFARQASAFVSIDARQHLPEPSAPTHQN
jgi:hypothetical protein